MIKLRFGTSKARLMGKAIRNICLYVTSTLREGFMSDAS
jgi:hypothetical protein